MSHFKNAKACAYYCWNAIYGNINTEFKKEWLRLFIEGYENYQDSRGEI